MAPGGMVPGRGKGPAGRKPVPKVPAKKKPRDPNRLNDRLKSSRPKAGKTPGKINTYRSKGSR